ncbi:MAG: Ribosomal small subunit methyltransferase [Bacteroidota bacterium]|jgi:16S rRNA (cytidine1402-2'-O)-methyltransferase
MSTGTLYLIPVPMDESTVAANVLPAEVIRKAASLKFFIAENAKTCRAFLKQLPSEFPLSEINVVSYDKHDRREADVNIFLQSLLQGHDTGLVSEAGCPAIADPGSEVVAAAHRRGIRVVPMIGPSSILLALMASGFNGQNFRFHGYLPIDPHERNDKLRQMENEAARNNVTQIFIETPFRNQQLFSALLSQLRAETKLCVALAITGNNEKILTRTMKEWKQRPEIAQKVPAIFLIGK